MPKVMDQVKQICRICLDLASSENASIADSIIRDKMNTVFNFPFESNDNLPTKVCPECFAKIDEFFTFSETVRSNQEQLAVRENTASIVEIKVEPANLQQHTDSTLDQNEPDDSFKVEIGLSGSDAESGEERDDKSDTEVLSESKSKRKTNKFQKRADENRKIREFYTLRCETCQKSFDELKELKRHTRSVHNKPAVIKCCGRELTQKQQLLSHIRLHISPKQFQCEFCEKSCARKHDLRMHILRMHEGTKQKPFKCDRCNQRFPKQYLLKTHMRTHIQVECSICHKVLSNAGALAKHMTHLHSDGNRYMCETCGKGFRSKQTLQWHIKQHLGLSLAERIQCPMCGKWISNKRNLKAHIKTVHEEADKTFTCDVCQQNYPSRKSLFTHKQRVHVDGKFECEFCGRKFKRRINLTEHRASHTGQTLYTCDVCGMTTNSNGNLYSHKKSKHPDEWLEAKRKALEAASG